MTRPLAQYDPFDPQVVETPWDFFAALRREAPLYELPNKAYYLISRYEDVRAAALDTETFSSNLVAIMLKGTDASPQLLNMADMGSGDPDGLQAADALAVADPPAHTRQRRVSNRTFSMRSVASLEEDIGQLVNELLDPILTRGECDWVKDFAVPLPMTMILRLLGLPIEDMPQLKAWSDHSIALLSGLCSADELMGHGLEAMKMVEYMATQVDLAKQKPRAGVVSDLVRESAADGESLSRNELVSILAQLVTAGNETTTSLLGSAVMLMVKTPGMQRRLREHPEQIGAFVEEALRLEPPIYGHFRLVKKDTEVAGQALPRDSRVMLLWSAANRDENEYPSPEVLDLNRPNLRMHLSFGHGIHHCLGAALARTEARIALEALLARTTDISFGPGNDFRHVPSLLVRGLQKLKLNLK
jgi:cytochrome P450